MSITAIPKIGYIVKLPENDMRMDDIFTDEMLKIDFRAIVEPVDRSHEAPSSFLVASKLINKTSIEKCLKLLPVLASGVTIKCKRDWQKEKKEAQKLIKQFKKLPACRKYPSMIVAINSIVEDAMESYNCGEYGISGDLDDYNYLVTIYQLLKAGFLAEAYNPIKKDYIIWQTPGYFPLPEKTLNAIEAAYVKKYKS